MKLKPQHVQISLNKESWFVPWIISYIVSKAFFPLEVFFKHFFSEANKKYLDKNELLGKTCFGNCIESSN